MFNASPIRHTAHIKSIGEFFPNFPTLSSLNLGHPFTKTAGCFKLMIPSTNVIIVWRLTTELNTKHSLHSNHIFCLCKLEITELFLFTSCHFSTIVLIGGEGEKISIRFVHMHTHTSKQNCFSCSSIRYRCMKYTCMLYVMNTIKR